MNILTNLLQNEDFEKLLIGILTLVTTFGFKYIYDDLDDSIEAILASNVMRKIYIFGFVFLATKDWRISLLLVIVYSILIRGIMSLKS